MWKELWILRYHMIALLTIGHDEVAIIIVLVHLISEPNLVFQSLFLILGRAIAKLLPFS